MSIQSTLDVRPTPCTTTPEVFQHPLIEDGRTPANTAERRELAHLTTSAQSACGDCPMMRQCLYQAVVEHDVAGIAGGTTARQRAAIRSKLGIRVEAEDFEGLLGLGAGRIDSHELLRQRMAHPHESLEQLAKRIGCSLSTIKRHLRRARSHQPEPRLQSVRPSVEQVLHATQLVVEGAPERRKPSITRAA